MRIEVEPGGLRRTAPALGRVGQEVEAVGAGTLPTLAGTAAACGSPVLASAVGGLLDGVSTTVQGAVVCLTELGRAVEVAAQGYLQQDAAVGATLRQGLQP